MDSRLISESYLNINKSLHDSHGMFGAGGSGWIGVAKNLLKRFPDSTMLDYGCGKGKLAVSVRQKFNIGISEYDPAIEGKDGSPSEADIVMCTDVLEHIEPECLAEVLLDIHRVTRRVAFLAISLRLAKKNLPDGRNAHLIVQPASWWEARLNEAGFFILDTGFAKKSDTACYLVRRHNEPLDHRDRL